MKIATGNHMTPVDLSWADRCKAVKAAGFDGIEVWIGTDDFSMTSTDDDLNILRDGIQSAGLEVSSIASTMGWDNPICSPDDIVHERAIEIATRQIEAARILETDAILVVTGRHSADNPQLVAWKRVVSGFRRIGRIAADKGVRVGAETCPRLSFNLMTPYECVGFVSDVGMDSVGIYLDTANVTYSGHPAHFITALGDHLVRIHFKDRTDKGATWPGNGEVDFVPVMAACREVGYDAWAIMEYGKPHTPETMRTAAETTRRVIEQ
jgi:L-ribulose-5-phosphate 3-epimerase